MLPYSGVKVLVSYGITFFARYTGTIIIPNLIQPLKYFPVERKMSSNGLQLSEEKEIVIS
jgi:hypothetical protein